MTLASLFDGIGGFPLVATRHGIRPVWASEIEAFPLRVTEIRFPRMTQHGDITKIDGTAVEPVDVVTFGSPCQDLSVAGKRAGMKHESKGDEETTRSGLFMEAVRIIKEMRDDTYGICPRYAIWENVPGAFSSNGGEDFRVVLEEIAKVADRTVCVPKPPKGKWQPAGALMGDGYSIAWRTMDAQYWGVPQRRRRIYLVCDFGGSTAPEILFVESGLRGDFAPGGQAGEGIAADASGGFTESGRGYWRPGIGTIRTNGSRPTNVIAHGFGVGESPDIAHCLMAGASKADKHESSTYIVQGFDGDIARTLTARHDSSPCADRGMNVIAVHLTQDPISMYDLSPCLSQGNPNNGQAVIGVALFENHGQDSRLTGPLDISPTVAAKFGTGGNNTPLVMAHGQANAEVMAGCVPTLNCNHEQPILCSPAIGLDHEKNAVIEGYGTLMARETGGGFEGAVKEPNSMTVRRLTPLEYERLQGYPDGWTDIPGASDSGRYKALGNSLAIPNAMFVISGIAKALRGDET